MLEKYKAKIPDTWQELLELAKKINGTDLNGDNETDYALCLDVNPCEISWDSIGRHKGWCINTISRVRMT